MSIRYTVSIDKPAFTGGNSFGDGNKSKIIIHLRFLGHLPLQSSPCETKIEAFESE